VAGCVNTHARKAAGQGSQPTGRARNLGRGLVVGCVRFWAFGGVGADLGGPFVALRFGFVADQVGVRTDS